MVVSPRPCRPKADSAPSRGQARTEQSPVRLRVAGKRHQTCKPDGSAGAKRQAWGSSSAAGHADDFFQGGDARAHQPFAVFAHRLQPRLFSRHEKLALGGAVVDQRTHLVVRHTINASTPGAALVAGAAAMRTTHGVPATRIWPGRVLRLAQRAQLAHQSLRQYTEQNPIMQAELIERLGPLAPLTPLTPLAHYRLRRMTGAKHQLRAYMNAFGLPICGHRIYPRLWPAQWVEFRPMRRMMSPCRVGCCG